MISGMTGSRCGPAAASIIPMAGQLRHDGATACCIMSPDVEKMLICSLFGDGEVVLETGGVVAADDNNHLATLARTQASRMRSVADDAQPDSETLALG